MWRLLAGASTRTQDLVLPSPWTTEEEIHIALPDGAEVTSLPHDQIINSGFGSVRLHYKKSANEILMQSHVQFEKARVSAAGLCGLPPVLLRGGTRFPQ